MKTLFFFLFLFPVFIQDQTTLDEIITDMTLAHEGRPHGVPTTFDWGLKPRVGALEPPAGWNAAIAWGQLYEWAGGNPATNTRVQIKDLEMYYLSKADQKWHLLQKSVGVDGNAYVEDFAGDVNKPADKRIQWKTNADMGISRFRFVSPEWKSYNMCSVPAAKIRLNPPPFVSLSTAINDFKEDVPQMTIYPNPVKSTSLISFSLEKKSHVNLSVYNIYGKKIETLLEGQINQGNHNMAWDASGLSSGIYMVRIENNEFAVVKKFQVIN